jgi:hypothetical protein
MKNHTAPLHTALSSRGLGKIRLDLYIIYINAQVALYPVIVQVSGILLYL